MYVPSRPRSCLYFLRPPTHGAHSCAALNGINQAIVDRASELVTLSARGENLIAACAVLSAGEMKALQDAV